MQEDTADQSGAYWTSSVSQVTDTNLYVRGYDLEDLIGRIPFTAAIFLVIRGRIPSGHEIQALDAVLSRILDYGLEKQRIPGLGQSSFKVVDPRAERLRSIALQEGLWDQAAEVYEAVHKAFTKLPGKSDIPINDVGVMAAILLGLGFTPEEGTGVALLSTLPGVIAHVSEEELSTGKPIRIVPRDSASYEGTTGRDFDADRLEAGWALPGPRR